MVLASVRRYLLHATLALLTPLSLILLSTPATLVTMLRVVVKDVTFSDGTFIPKDTFICASTLGTHRDDGVYADPDVLDPFRFSRGKPDGPPGTEGTKHQLPNTSAEFIPFGHGGHAWCVGLLLLKALPLGALEHTEYIREDE